LQHGVTSSRLNTMTGTSGVDLLSIAVHILVAISNIHMSLRVLLPFVPPKINRLPLCSTIAKLDRP
jgi:hypothetical protein